MKTSKVMALVLVTAVTLLCSFPASAATLSSEERYTSSSSYLDGDLTADVSAYVGKPFIVEHDYNFIRDSAYYGTTNQPYPANPYNWQSQTYMTFYDVPVTISVTFTNKADYYAYAGNTFVALTPNFTFKYAPEAYYFETESEGAVLYDVTAGGQFRFRLTDQSMVYNGRLAIGRGGTYTLSYTIHFLYLIELGVLNSSNVHVYGTNFDQSINYININSVGLDAPQTWLLSNVDGYANPNITSWQLKEVIQNIFNLLHDHFDSYNSVQDESTAVSEESQGVSSDVSSQHQQEAQYFSDTSDAIDDTGLSTYQFDQGTSSGLHGIKDDFTAVWNSCGSLSNVWIFSLTFSVALSIIRHVRLKHF